MEPFGPLKHALQGDNIDNSTQVGAVIKDTGILLFCHMPGEWQRTIDGDGDLLLGCTTDEPVSSIDVNLGKVLYLSCFPYAFYRMTSHLGVTIATTDWCAFQHVYRKPVLHDVLIISNWLLHYINVFPVLLHWPALTLDWLPSFLPGILCWVNGFLTCIIKPL
jgi:hypothetical protein